MIEKSRFRKQNYCLVIGLVLLLFLFQKAAAQINKLTVKVPDFKRFVIVTQDNVNLRRTPSVNGGKLMRWNSDGGSYDTYCKIFFADTESKLYRPNSMTGAFVETFHPMNGDFLPVNPNSIESQNGWYQVGVIANSYGGNPGHANAKLAWIKGDFCKVVDVDMNAKPSQIAFPRNFSYDEEREEEVKGPLVTIREGLRRKSGLYTNLTFFVTASPDGNSILVAAPILSSHFVFIARTSIDVQYDSEQKSAVVLHEVEEENEMGDVDTFLRLTTNTEAQKSKAAVNYILAASDQVFGKLVKFLFPENKIPTDEVYFMDTEGKCQSFGYDPIVSSVIPAKSSSMSLQKVADSSLNSKSTEKTFDVVENMPSYPGGRAAMMAFLSSNMNYPATAKENNVQGRVIIGFVVEKDGSISEVKVLRSVDPALDQEALRLVNSMPKWKPGTMDGKPVRVRYSVPFTFRL